MQVKKVYETPEGTMTFEGELKEDELRFAVEVGLNLILAHGSQAILHPEEDTVEATTH